jgi:hypothetical protein
MSLRTGVGARLDLVALEGPATATPDGEGGYVQSFAPLDPATVWAEVKQGPPGDQNQQIAVGVGGDRGTVNAAAAFTMRLPFHPTVNTYTRVSWSDRAGRARRGAVLGVTSDPACRETILVIEEVIE